MKIPHLRPQRILTLAVAANLLLWLLVFLPKGSAGPEPQAPEKMDDMSDLGALVQMLTTGARRSTAEWGSGELPVLAAPPWTRLERADLEKLAAGTGAPTAGMFPELPPEQRLQLRQEAFENTQEAARFFPYKYTGLLRLRGEYRALIEDADTGASYFRRQGERIGHFTVLELSKTSLTLLHEKNGRQIRLLKTPDAASAGSQE